MITQKQLSVSDIFQDCQNKFEEDKPAFLELLETHIDLDEIVPATFCSHYYAATGRNRKYPLYAMIWALIIQKIFSIPTDQLLLTFLHYSKALREFCGFSKVPDASKLTRFKQDFLDDLQIVFERLVDITEPICQAIHAEKAAMTIFDSSGIEAYVKENNPKYANQMIRQLKTYAKQNNFDQNYDPYKAAYRSMPTCASTNPEIKQLYINGHFCYAFKFGVITNGLGIVRHIAFYNEKFFQEHPEIIREKKSNSPDEDKSVSDARLLLPTLNDFFRWHPLIHPKTFLGDSAFDSATIYKTLLKEPSWGTNADGIPRCFSKAYIPLNVRSAHNSEDSVNENGIPCCPNDPSLTMASNGRSIHSGITRQKFCCPKSKIVKDLVSGKRIRKCFCPEPCTSSPYGRVAYVYPEKDLRRYPGTVRGTAEWNNTYKCRTVVERQINHMKDNLCVAGRKTFNQKTIHADLLLAGITQLLTVLLADKIHNHKFIRSLKPLIA